jgi:hypothetical protein
MHSAEWVSRIREREKAMSKSCPDCEVGILSHDKVSGLDQCANRYGCGYGWYDNE